MNRTGENAELHELIARVAPTDLVVMADVRRRFDATVAQVPRAQREPLLAATEEPFEWQPLQLWPGEAISGCMASRVRAIGGRLRNGTGRWLLRKGGRECRDAWSTRHAARAHRLRLKGGW